MVEIVIGLQKGHVIYPKNYGGVSNWFSETSHDLCTLKVFDWQVVHKLLLISSIVAQENIPP